MSSTKIMIIKNIIFDIGNVLFKYDPMHIIASLLPNTKKKDLYFNELFQSDLWQKLDRGDLTETVAIKQLSQKFKLTNQEEAELKLLINEFPDYLIPNQNTIDILIYLSKKYNIYILSNFQSAPFKRLEKKHDFFNLIKGKVISNDVMMKKPELGIYDYLITKYRLIPSECIFIDDLKENIATAKKILINGIQYESSNQLKKDLTRYSIHIK